MLADRLPFRMTIVLLASIATVGPNLCRESYNVLQKAMVQVSNCSSEKISASCCPDCMGLGDQNYNNMFAIIFWTSAVSLIAVGFLLDRLGSPVFVILSMLSFAGTCLVATGSSSSSVAARVLTFAGAGLLGLSYLPAVVARGRVISIWFRGKELAFAFGFATAINRVVSLLTFAFMELIREAVGLQLTLWLASAVTLLSLVCSVGVALLDAYGARQLGLTEELQLERQSVRVSQLGRLGLEFWILLTVYAAFSTAFNLLLDNGAEFVHEKFTINMESSAMLAGALRYVGIAAAPLSGLLVDKVGRQAYLHLAALLLLLPGVTLLTFTTVHPAVGWVLIGLCCCFLYVSMEGTMTQVVARAAAGTALGTAFCITTFVLGIFHAIDGWILGWEPRLPRSVKLHRWQMFMLVNLLLFLAAIGAAVLQICVSRWRGSEVTAGKSEKSNEAKYEELKQQED